MENNQIYLNIQDNKVKLSFKKAIPFDEFIQLLFSGILGQANSIIRQQPTQQQQDDCRAALYDLINMSASNLLQLLDPESELRPHLTTQAILEAENKIIMEGRAPKLEVPELPDSMQNPSGIQRVK